MAKHSNGLIEHVIALPARACIIFTYDRGECMPYGGHGSRLNAYMLKSRRVSNKHVLYQCTSSAINRGSHTARKAKSAKRRNNELFLSQKKQLVVSSGNKETSCCPTGPKETPCCDKETKNNMMSHQPKRNTMLPQVETKNIMLLNRPRRNTMFP